MVTKSLTSEEETMERACVREMKKTPLFEYEVPLYRKRPTEWFEDKPTR